MYVSSESIPHQLINQTWGRHFSGQAKTIDLARLMSQFIGNDINREIIFGTESLEHLKLIKTLSRNYSVSGLVSLNLFAFNV